MQYEIASDYDHLCRYTNAFRNCLVSRTVMTNFKGGGLSEIRSFEGALEEELIRMRIFKSKELAVRSRLLVKCANNIAATLAKLVK